MIPLHEDTGLLRKLIFHGDMTIDREVLERPSVKIDTYKFLPLCTYETEAGCPVCEEPYKPFNNCDAVVWVQPACANCMLKVWSGAEPDELVNEVSRLLIAKAHLIMFDNLCLERPWLLSESFAYNRAFLDWCEMYNILKKEFDSLVAAIKRELPEQKKAEKKSWISSWFQRK